MAIDDTVRRAPEVTEKAIGIAVQYANRAETLQVVRTTTNFPNGEQTISYRVNVVPYKN